MRNGEITWNISGDDLNFTIFSGTAVSSTDQWWGLTSKDGLFLIGIDGLEKIQTSADEFLASTVALDLQMLDNDWMAISTRKGVLVLDQNGKVIQELTTEQGICGNFTTGTFQDKQRALWLATSSGISRVEVVSPFTIFDKRNGLEGFVNMVHRHDGHLYAAGQTGFKVLRKSAVQNGPFRFYPIEGSNLHALYLMSRGNELFAASRGGVFTINDFKLSTINNFQSGALLQSKKDSNLIYIGYRGALGLMRRADNGEWKLMDVIEEVDSDIREMIEDRNGRLWIEPQENGIWLVEFTEMRTDTFSDYTHRFFRTGEQLPTGSVFLHEYEGEAMFQINGKIYVFNERLDSITEDLAFASKFGFTGEIAPKLTADANNRWIKAQVGNKERKDLFYSSEQDDSLHLEFIDMRRITQIVGKAVFPEDKILWHGGRDGIIRHDLKMPVNSEKQLQVLIRRISLEGDSMIYAGAGSKPALDLAYGHDFRFEFALPSFDHEAANSYQYYLQGFDEDWSQWTNENQKDYTRIPEGDYTFRIRGKKHL